MAVVVVGGTVYACPPIYTPLWDAFNDGVDSVLQ